MHQAFVPSSSLWNFIAAAASWRLFLYCLYSSPVRIQGRMVFGTRSKCGARIGSSEEWFVRERSQPQWSPKPHFRLMSLRFDSCLQMLRLINGSYLKGTLHTLYVEMPTAHYISSTEHWSCILLTHKRVIYGCSSHSIKCTWCPPAVNYSSTTLIK